MQPILQMCNITKSFPRIIANDNVDLSIYCGEIHALLGENGAGKSTLMNVLTGIYKADLGKILYQGEEINLKSPKDSIDLGIGMVHQHFRLVESLTVTENIYLGSTECKNVLDMDSMHKEVKIRSNELGLDVTPKAKIWQLSVGEQQRVEIVRLLFRGTEILILDEPTAILTPQESRNLFATLRKMADSGKAILFISHKLFEVMSYSDRVTILKDGKNVGSTLTKNTSEDELTRMMIGRELNGTYVELDSADGFSSEKKTVLQIKDLVVKGDRNQLALDNLNLEAKAGEILGIAGVAGNGQRELPEAILGLRKINSGSINLDGTEITSLSSKQIRNSGVAYVPEDRQKTGLAINLNSVDNIMLRDFDTNRSAKLGIISNQRVEKRTKELISSYNIKVSDAKAPVRLMSGGNQQKLILARKIDSNPKLLIVAYPSRGLDVGAINFVHSKLMEERDKGKTVMVISEDLEELFAISDRIAVLFQGRITGVVPRSDFSYDEIGYLMVGSKRKGKVEQNA